MTRAARAAAILVAAALGARGARAFAEVAGAVELGFRLAPAETRVYLDGQELALRGGRNGIRFATLAPGRKELLLLADGYTARRIAVDARPGAPLVEEKLERCGSPLELEAMGRTGARPKSVSFTPDGRWLVLPLLSGRGAEVLDARSLVFVGSLEPPASMGKIEGFVESAFFPARGEIWVSQMHNSMVHVFDLESFAYKESFPSGGSYPKVIAASPDGARAYVSNWVSEDLAIIDAATRKLVAKVKTGGTPRGLAPSPDGRWLYIARFSDGAILRLDLAATKLETVYAPDGGAKRHLVLDPARRRLYATDMGRGSLFAFDTETWKVLAELRLGPNPNGCALSPDGRWIFACTRGPDGEDGYEKKGPLAGELFAIDAERLAIVARQWGGAQPTGLAVSPDGERVLFTDFLDRRVEAYRLGPAFHAPAAEDKLPSR